MDTKGTDSLGSGGADTSHSLITLSKEDLLASQGLSFPLLGGPGQWAGRVGKGVAKALLPAQTEAEGGQSERAVAEPKTMPLVLSAGHNLLWPEPLP